MTEENSNYLWGCATTLVIIALIIGSIWAYFALKDRADEQKAQAKEEEVRLRRQQESNKLNTDLWEAQSAMADSFRKFYSNCFTVKRMACPPSYFSGQLVAPTLVIGFTNYTGRTVEAVLFGVTVTDKLGNRILATDFQLTNKVPSYGSIDVSYTLSEQFGLCKYGKDELEFLFSLPFTKASSTNEFGAQTYRSTDIVIRFLDGSLVRDFSTPGQGWVLPDRTEDLKRQIELLRVQ